MDQRRPNGLEVEVRLSSSTLLSERMAFLSPQYRKTSHSFPTPAHGFGSPAENDNSFCGFMLSSSIKDDSSPVRTLPSGGLLVTTANGAGIAAIVTELRTC